MDDWVDVCWSVFLRDKGNSYLLVLESNSWSKQKVHCRKSTCQNGVRVTNSIFNGEDDSSLNNASYTKPLSCQQHAPSVMDPSRPS